MVVISPESIGPTRATLESREPGRIPGSASGSGAVAIERGGRDLGDLSMELGRVEHVGVRT